MLKLLLALSCLALTAAGYTATAEAAMGYLSPGRPTLEPGATS